MKDSLLQNVKIGLFAILFLLMTVFTVLSFIPEHTDVEVSEEFTVSSSAVSANDSRFILEVSGELLNTTEEDISLEEVRVWCAGLSGPVVHDSDIVLSPRTPGKVVTWVESDVSADEVTKVSVLLNGEETVLRNPAVTNTFRYAALPLILSVLFLLFLLHAILVRIYIEQEKDIWEKHPEQQKS